MNRNVNWGVMGTARIAGYGVIPGMLNSDNSNLSSNKNPKHNMALCLGFVNLTFHKIFTM